MKSIRREKDKVGVKKSQVEVPIRFNHGPARQNPCCSRHDTLWQQNGREFMPKLHHQCRWAVEVCFFPRNGTATVLIAVLLAKAPQSPV
jgi:hypothetical protein